MKLEDDGYCFVCGPKNPIGLKLDFHFNGKTIKKSHFVWCNNKENLSYMPQDFIIHHLDLNFDEDPELYASFAETLERILKEFKDNWQRIYEELEKLRRKIKNMPKPPGGLHRKKQMPFFRIFSREIYSKVFGEDKYTDEELDDMIDLTKEIFDTIKREIQLTGFWDSIPARNKLKAEIQKILLSERFNKLPNIINNRNHIISRVMELAQANNDIILYAE